MAAKTIVITGGASGVGAALVNRLAAAGHDLHVLDVQTPKKNIGAYHPCDLSEQAALEACIAQLPGKIDAVVQVAGLATAEPKSTVMAVNFLAVRHLAQALLPRIPRGGTLVTVASTAGLQWQNRQQVVDQLLATHDFATGRAWCRDNESLWLKDPYTFSKQCVTAWGFHMAETFRHTGVRVNTISPGSIDTPLTPAFRQLMGDDQSDWTVQQIGRAATPDDIAAILEWLAVGDCSWLNGVNIPVDGGQTAGLTAGWIDFNQSPLGLKMAARKDAKKQP